MADDASAQACSGMRQRLLPLAQTAQPLFRPLSELISMANGHCAVATMRFCFSESACTHRVASSAPAFRMAYTGLALAMTQAKGQRSISNASVEHHPA
eukprot:scaffold1499_cov255-Pinguiococcus_pyrenoidosus.AAC.27